MKTLTLTCLWALLPVILVGSLTPAGLQAQSVDPASSLRRIRSNIQRIQRELRNLNAELEKLRASLAKTPERRTQARQRRARPRRGAGTPERVAARRRAGRKVQERRRRSSLRKVTEPRQNALELRKKIIERRRAAPSRREAWIEGFDSAGIRGFGYPPLAWYLWGFGPRGKTTVIPRSRITIRSLPGHGGASILVIPELRALPKKSKKTKKTERSKKPVLLRKKRSYL